MQLILASSSRYRRELLARLCIPFDVAVPEIDESSLFGEMPTATAERLSAEKAHAVARRYSNALIIGSDQVAFIDNDRFGKPGTVEKAIDQLKRMRGRTVVFHTGVALLNAETRRIQICGVPTQVRFRDLNDGEIARYVEREMPLDCAGSAKVEALGITLLEALSTNDPTALIGLPLIALSRMLRAEGVRLP